VLPVGGASSARTAADAPIITTLGFTCLVPPLHALENCRTASLFDSPERDFRRS
jgi:hypothetical protein